MTREMHANYFRFDDFHRVECVSDPREMQKYAKNLTCVLILNLNLDMRFRYIELPCEIHLDCLMMMIANLFGDTQER